MFNKLKYQILTILEDYGKEKTRQAQNCCQKYAQGHKLALKDYHGDISSFNANFFSRL